MPDYSLTRVIDYWGAFTIGYSEWLFHGNAHFPKLKCICEVMTALHSYNYYRSTIPNYFLRGSIKKTNPGGI